ncbi:hypothetical protein [Dermacoccus abyssi]|uniref:hypothetical protein n=1 Tax=Dermacoccus abyssi TaxID=322596 RepID=UPI002AD59153|nr:hypothetical protein [Dermacoccus abyssi]
MGIDKLTDAFSNDEDHDEGGEDARNEARAIDEGSPEREIVSDDPGTPTETTG